MTEEPTTGGARDSGCSPLSLQRRVLLPFCVCTLPPGVVVSLLVVCCWAQHFAKSKTMSCLGGLCVSLSFRKASATLHLIPLIQPTIRHRYYVSCFCVDSIVAVTFVNYASLSISRARSRAEKASGYDWHLSLWKVAVKMWQTPPFAPCFLAFLLCLELLL